ncbi:MAG: dihydrolipoamide acetyltransferase family protein [Saprospiraceae bacterium]
MSNFELVLPKLGESITDATIITWLKNVGDTIEEDEPICEIATDKVDSEVPSQVSGTIIEILYEADDVVEVGKVIAIIAIEGSEQSAVSSSQSPVSSEQSAVEQPVTSNQDKETNIQLRPSVSNRFYSPLARSIAEQENISATELENINGTGENNRVKKSDILAYLKARTQETTIQKTKTVQKTVNPKKVQQPITNHQSPITNSNVEIIQMDRMRKMIAKHMVDSKRISPHVTSFVEVDMTNVVNWRNKNKKAFLAKYGTKITFTPIFVEAVTKAIKDFPAINASVDGDNVIIKKDINIGIAAALPSGNLIVPVIKNADYLNLQGIAKQTNNLVDKARNNKLKPDDISGGTYTISNVGTFGNIMGTPIINQPQVAILATGVIQKKPAVVETEYGDVIAIRHKMFLSHSYDHRVVDGFLGGSFLRRVADYLEAFDVNRAL